MSASEILLTLPDWVVREVKNLPAHLKELDQRMSTIIRFSRLNFENGTGGPFAAGVFEHESGKLVALGVNRVVAMNCSSAHAEIMALSLAQQRLQTYDLGGQGLPSHQLVVNGMPCAMCFGAVLWSGVRSLAIGISGTEVEQLTGFDEGPLHPDWTGQLKERGIELIQGVRHEDARKVFSDFHDSGSLVYNARGGG